MDMSTLLSAHRSIHVCLCMRRARRSFLMILLRHRSQVNFKQYTRTCAHVRMPAHTNAQMHAHRDACMHECYECCMRSDSKILVTDVSRQTALEPKIDVRESTRSTSSNIFGHIFCFWRSQNDPARQRRSERSERSPPRAHSPSSHQPRPSPLIGLQIITKQPAHNMHSGASMAWCLRMLVCVHTRTHSCTCMCTNA